MKKLLLIGENPQNFSMDRNPRKLLNSYNIRTFGACFEYINRIKDMGINIHWRLYSYPYTYILETKYL